MSNEGKREAGLSALRRGKYISLATFRKNGEAVYTPLWFAEQDGKLYVMTRDDSWKYKRIRNNSQRPGCALYHTRANHWARIAGQGARTFW